MQNTVNDKLFKNYGWICPVCGRGNSPFTSTCPCKPIDVKITCNNAYEKALDHYYNTGVK